MSYVLFAPEMVAAAAADLGAIGSSISTACALAATRTSIVPAAAGDEVSTAVADVFGAYATQFQKAVARAATFHGEFTRALADTAGRYARTEAANAALVAQRTVTALIVGGTDEPGPPPGYTAKIDGAYIQTLFPGALSQALPTPEQFWPVTGNLTFGQSVAQGVTLLNNAIDATITPTNDVVVSGYSQSATIATLEINALMAQGAPHADQLSFVLMGNPNNPDGGILERFPGFYIPVLDVPFSGATPPNSPYLTFNYTAQYDGYADAPQYPLDVLSDLNAIMGTLYVHTGYENFTATQVADALPLPTSPGYTGDTHYYLFLTQNLPLVQPIRDIPYVGPPIADLIQPDLRVLVDLGYGNATGADADYANVPTPARLFQVIDPFVVTADLATGAVQGSQAALVDVGVLPPADLPNTYPYVPSPDPGLAMNLGQPSVTGLSVLSGVLGSVLHLIPPGPYC